MRRWWLLLVFIIKYCLCGIERLTLDPDKFISQAHLESSTCITENTIRVGLASSTSDPKSGYPRWKFSCGSGFITHEGKISTLKAISDIIDEYACMLECEYHRDQGCEGFTFVESNQRCDLKDGAGSFDLGDGFVGGLVSGKMITTDLCGECLQYFPRQLVRNPKKISDRSCFTNGGANPGANCVFPFTFAGRTHKGCTLGQTEQIFESEADAKFNEALWCSTKTDQNGKHVGGEEQWGYCSSDCKQDIEGTKVGAVDNTGVNGAVTNPVTGKKCGQDKLRKDVRDLSEREITGLRRAMNAIISSGMFGKLANYHGAPFTMCEPTGHHSWGCCPHDVDTFLPWHRLYLVNMEKALEKHLKESGLEYLGMPYWDWTRDNQIPTLFDDLPFPNFADQAVNGERLLGTIGRTNARDVPNWKRRGQSIARDGSLMLHGYNASRLLEGFKSQCSNELRSIDLPELKIYQLSGRVAGALKQRDFKKFSDALSSVHGAIHVELGCVLGPPQSAAYDPVFWMHHSFVDKVFSIWQSRWGHWKWRGGPRNGFLAATRDKRMEPFDNPKHNDYRFITDRKAHQTWDHGAELCYEYDEIRVDTSDDSTRRECFVKFEQSIKQFNSTVQVVEERPSVVCKKPLSAPREVCMQCPTAEGGWEQVCGVDEGDECRCKRCPNVDGGYDVICDEDAKCECKECPNAAWNPTGFDTICGDIDKMLCPGDMSTHDIDTHVAIVAPKHYGGKLHYELCYEDTDCVKDNMSIFGALPEGSSPGTPLDSGHFQIRKDLIVEKPAIPEGLYDFNWSSLTLQKGAKEISPVPPFMVFELETGKVPKKEFVHLAKGVSRSQYGDLLNDYKFVLNYCDVLTYGGLSFPLGDPAECS